MSPKNTINPYDKGSSTLQVAKKVKDGKVEPLDTSASSSLANYKLFKDYTLSSKVFISFITHCKYSWNSVFTK